MQGKVALITGANRGIGKATARTFARRGATIVMACRNMTKANSACEAIKQETGNTHVEVTELGLVESHLQIRLVQLARLVRSGNSGEYRMTKGANRDPWAAMLGNSEF